MSALYPLWKQSLETEADVNKSLDQTSSTNACYAALVTIGGGSYNYSASHQYYSTVQPYVQGTPQQITTPTVANGVFKGDVITFTNVSGSAIGAVVIYRQNSGANTTWRLIAYLDSVTFPGLPYTPTGGNITLGWNALGIFKLGT